jgi:putative transposase
MGEKNVKGRKRTIAVDTMVNLHGISVDEANIHDVHLGSKMIQKMKEKFPNIKNFLADAGYRGTAVKYAESLGCTLHISKKIKDIFAIQPTRWIVERTFAWLNNFRRLSKDYEITPLSSENYIKIVMIRIGLNLC